jgi:hypothetical protein
MANLSTLLPRLPGQDGHSKLLGRSPAGDGKAGVITVGGGLLLSGGVPPDGYRLPALRHLALPSISFRSRRYIAGILTYLEREVLAPILPTE